MGKSGSRWRRADLQRRGDGLAGVESGHGCCIVPEGESREETGARLLRQALRSGKKVLWIGGPAGDGHPITLESVLAPGDRGCLGTGQARIVDLFAGTPPSRDVDPATALARIRSAVLDDLQEPMDSAVRVLVDTAGLRVLFRNSRRFQEFETGLSALAGEWSVEIICIFQEIAEEPGTLLHALDLHPYLAPRSRLLPNPWFRPSPEPGDPIAPGSLADRMDLLAHLAETGDGVRCRDTLTKLHQALGAAFDQDDPEEALAIFLGETCRAVDWPVGRVFLPEGDPPQLRLSPIRHLEGGIHGPGSPAPESLGAPGLIEAKGDGVVGEAWASGRGCWAPSSPTSNPFKPWPHALPESIRGEYALPIVAGGELFAIFWFLSRSSRPPEDSLLATLEMAGQRLGESFRRQQVESRLSTSEHRMKSVITVTAHGIIMADPEGLVLSWNPSAERLFGRPAEQVRGIPLTNLFTASTRQRLTLALREVMGTPGAEAAATTLSAEGLGQDGREIPLEVTLARWESGGRAYVTVAIHDLTEKILLEDALHPSDRDPLTGLPNQGLLLRRLGRSMARGQERPNYRYALLLLNLDGFRELDGSLGPIAEDRFLIEVAQRLETSVRPGDTVARLAGNELAVLLEYVEKVQDVILVTERILTGMDQPFRVGDQEVRTSARVGIALSDSEYSDPSTMLAEADAAMARARHIRRPYEIADTESYKETLAFFRLESDLRASLQKEEFIIHYQPLVSVDSGRIVGFEALARWDHPERGVVGPDQFIPALEASGMIRKLGRWARKEASAQIAHWQRGYPSSPPLMLSVNVSPVELEDPEFVGGIRSVLEETGLEASSLHLEITESVFMKRPDRVLKVLAELKALGVQAWIDDFGTGYSSLGYLHHFPVGLLKIDRLFVASLDQTKLNKSIVSTILDLAANLGISALAEGVETPDQLDQLRQLSCRYAQGFLFSKPVEHLAAERLLAGQGRQPLEVKGWG